MNISVVCFSSSIMRLFTMKGTLSKYQQKKIDYSNGYRKKNFRLSFDACQMCKWTLKFIFRNYGTVCNCNLFEMDLEFDIRKTLSTFCPRLVSYSCQISCYNISRNQWKTVVLFRSRVEAHTYSYGSQLD